MADSVRPAKSPRLEQPVNAGRLQSVIRARGPTSTGTSVTTPTGPRQMVTTLVSEDQMSAEADSRDKTQTIFENADTDISRVVRRFIFRACKFVKSNGRYMSFGGMISTEFFTYLILPAGYQEEYWNLNKHIFIKKTNERRGTMTSQFKTVHKSKYRFTMQFVEKEHKSNFSFVILSQN
jgi:hypothetical protein